MGKTRAVTIDPLPLKRMLALEESGTELYPPEPSQEEKPLALVQSIDFGQPAEKEAKKAKTGKDGGPAQQAWPWAGLVEQFRLAREELITLLDFIAHVEANEVLTVTNMTKPKPLPHENCADLALRTSSKMHEYKDIGKYLKRNAKALERQVERESAFYEALMRLQRNWKVKRQRNVSAGPGGKAGFTMDLSFPLALDMNLISSSRTAPLSLINVDQDQNGLLLAHVPSGRSISSLQLYIGDAIQEMDTKPNLKQESVFQSDEKDGKPVNDGTKAANYMLRRIQLSMFDELIFECLSREALQPASTTSLVGIGDTSLHIGLGDKLTALFKLVKDLELSGGETDEKELQPQSTTSAIEASSRIFLQQAFYALLLGKLSNPKTSIGPKSGAGKDEATSLLKQFSVVIRHRLAASKVVSLLEKQVHGVPQLWFLSHPTWKPCVTAWDVFFDIPQAVLRGGQIKYQEWNSLMRVTRVTFQCTVVLRQEALLVEGLDGCLPLGKAVQKNLPESTEMRSCVCSISELPIFLLSQIAGKIVMWLEEEALLLVSRVKRNFLSIIFDMENNGQVSLVAAPSSYCINWWLRVYAGGTDETTSTKEKSGPAGLSSERFLGPLPLETLRALVMDLMHLVKGTDP